MLHRPHEPAFYIAGDLQRWSDEHVILIAEAGHRYGVELDGHPRTHSLTEGVQEWVSDRLGRRPEPALLLLIDLRRLHRLAAGASLDWELLAQGAQGAKDMELIELCQRCHPESLRQMRWANAMLKELAPQVLAS